MSTPPDDSEVEAALQTLGALAASATAEQQEALALAANALLFLHARQQLDAFREYLREASAPAHLTVRIEREFDDMAQATHWLHTQPPPAHGTHVRVAGRTYAVWRDDAGQQVLVPSMTPEELDARRK
jgi:hypothetical protein